MPNVRMLLAAAVLSGVAACSGGQGTSADATDRPLPPSDPSMIFFAPELDVDLTEFEQSSSGLYVQDVEIGDGPVARRDSRVWIHYVGWLPDGTVFDGSLGGDPYHLRLGGREVIRGWNEGIVGMRRGGERRLVVPPGLAYGSRGSGDVPPGATLIFHLQLIDVD
ncbi:MAG: FKBP-type peptidyl-prolyl cis-trans isomerase [Gemmatimonadota bacterium]